MLTQSQAVFHEAFLETTSLGRKLHGVVEEECRRKEKFATGREINFICLCDCFPPQLQSDPKLACSVGWTIA